MHTRATHTVASPHARHAHVYARVATRQTTHWRTPPVARCHALPIAGCPWAAQGVHHLPLATPPTTCHSAPSPPLPVTRFAP
eukprot:4800335-Alexandrium_andersonii.AAC.1